MSNSPKQTSKGKPMTKFNRGDRVELIGIDSQWGSIRGVVTHLNGDPPHPEYRPEDIDSKSAFVASPDEVWVVWDQPCTIEDCWIDEKDLKAL